MSMSEPSRVWTVAEAKARLSEVLRLAEEEGPQRIGTRKSFVVLPESDWQSYVAPSRSLGRWLIENIPRGVELMIPGNPRERPCPPERALNQALKRVPERDPSEFGMSGHLLDTSVIAELTNASPNSGVVDFLSDHDDLWLSSVVLHELELRLQLLPQGQGRDDLRLALGELTSEFGDRILPLGRREAEWAARLGAQARLAGQVPRAEVALLAGSPRRTTW